MEARSCVRAPPLAGARAFTPLLTCSNRRGRHAANPEHGFIRMSCRLPSSSVARMLIPHRTSQQNAGLATAPNIAPREPVLEPVKLFRSPYRRADRPRGQRHLGGSPRRRDRQIRLARRPATIDRHDMSRDMGGLLGAQKDDDLCDLLRLAPTAKRDYGQY